MSKHDEIQQGPPDYLSPPLSQSELLDRQDALRATHTEALQSVESMVREQQEVSTHLNDGIAQMKRRSADMDALEVTQSPGLLARITRLISRRDDVLARRSISDALVQTHERSVIDLRRASEVADNLQRTAAELHSEVEELTAEQSQARQNLRLAAQQVLELEAAMDGLDSREDLEAQARATQMDAMVFQERQRSAEITLIQAHVDLCSEEIASATALRDTVQTMHEDMSQFVLNAGKAVNSAGRKIQSLGMAADAAMVVLELNASMVELDAAMNETTRYLAQADELLTRVLPDLNARICATEGVKRLSVDSDLDRISRSRAKALADQALRAAAEEEVERLSER